MKNRMSITKKIAGTLVLPISMYLIMMALTHANGVTYFGTWAMWKTMMVDIAVAITSALAIGLQFKNGRFDFSGGSIMLLSAIIAGNVAKSNGNDITIFIVLTIGLCLIFSILVALMYIYGRLPIIITTIAMALFYESLTTLIYNGGGINLVANMDLKVFSTYPYVLIPLFAAIAVYAIFSYLTLSGKKGELLANNQQAAVNIGINEKKNVVISFVYSGLIYGFATMIFASTALHQGAFNSLTTVASLFTNILPVFIGLLLASFCGDTLGIIIGAITLSIMSFGLDIVLSAEMGSAIATIITGIFILVINIIHGRGSEWVQNLKDFLNQRKAET